MKVLLLADIRDIGKKMEVRDVAAGYARNYLIPKNLVMPVTENALKRKADADASANAARTRAQSASQELKTITLTLTGKTGKNGELFGSIRENDIAAALRGRGFHFCNILLERPLKTTGEHRVTVDLGYGVTTEVTVLIQESP